MASANQKRATFLSQKLEFLKDQGDQLNGAVELYVNGIIAAGQSWTEGGDKQVGFLQLCQMVDTAVDFLCEKCEELTGRSVNAAANQLSGLSCEQSDLTSQSETALATGTSSRHSSEPLQPAESDKKNRSNRSIEGPIRDFNVRQTATNQDNKTRLQSLKKQLQKLSTTQDRMKSKMESQTELTEKQLQKLSTTQDRMIEEMESQTELTEKQLQKLSTTQDRMKEEMESQAELTEKQLQKLSTTQDRMKEEMESQAELTEKQLQKLSTTQDRMKEEMESQAELTEKQLQKLSTTQDRMKEEMESQTELTEKLVHVPDQLESMEEKLDVLDARIGRIMDDCSNKHQEIEHVTRDLADKVKANTETVQVISADQDQKTTLLRELETRMQTLEADSGRNVEQVEKGETNLRILCQMLNNRLTPLEQLRNCLSQLTIKRDENIKKLSQLIQEVAVMSPRLQQLELKSSRPRCGFTAVASFSEVTGLTVRPYENPETNVGGNFDADSGIFTAPVDGLYVAAISLYIYENTPQNVSVRYNKQSLSQSLSTLVCGNSAGVKGATACNVGLVEMSAGDTLFSSVNQTMAVVTRIVRFTCFLLS